LKWSIGFLRLTWKHVEQLVNEKNIFLLTISHATLLVGIINPFIMRGASQACFEDALSLSLLTLSKNISSKVLYAYMLFST
jgi:hypothetical protein